MYRNVPIATRAGAEEPFIEALEFCAGQQTPDASVIHVRGVCANEIPFAGCVVVCEGGAIPEHDLKSYGAPLDLERLAVVIDRLLGKTADDRDARGRA